MNLTTSQQDALKELLNIGFGRAAASLSQLTGHRVLLDVPAVSIHPPGTMPPSMPEPAAVARPELPPSFQRVPEIQRSESPRVYEQPRGPVTLRVDRQGQIIVTPREPTPPSLARERPVLAPQTGELGAGPAVVVPPQGDETFSQ